MYNVHIPLLSLPISRSFHNVSHSNLSLYIYIFLFLSFYLSISLSISISISLSLFLSLTLSHSLTHTFTPERKKIGPVFTHGRFQLTSQWHWLCVRDYNLTPAADLGLSRLIQVEINLTLWWRVSECVEAIGFYAIIYWNLIFTCMQCSVFDTLNVTWWILRKCYNRISCLRKSKHTIDMVP